jgi:hypothetical protein
LEEKLALADDRLNVGSYALSHWIVLQRTRQNLNVLNWHDWIRTLGTSEKRFGLVIDFRCFRLLAILLRRVPEQRGNCAKERRNSGWLRFRPVLLHRERWRLNSPLWIGIRNCLICRILLRWT